MTGPEHYREAERLLAGTEKRGPWADGSGASTQPPTPTAVALAQAHATLALVAATALAGRTEMDGADAYAWEKACGVQP